jgi:hypothetical protein
MTKQEKKIYTDIIMGANELKTLLNGKEKTLKNIKFLNEQELIDNMNFINNKIKTTNISKTKIDIKKVPHKIKNPITGEILIFSHILHGQLSYMKTVFARPGKGFEHVSESDLYRYEILEQTSTKSLSQELREKYDNI